MQLTRGLDTNQVNIFQNGFLADFLRARNNCIVQGATISGPGSPLDKCTGAAFNAAIPGSQQLTIISRLGSGGNLTNATILNLIRQNRVGELVSNYVSQRNTFLNTAQPCIETGVGRPCPSFFLPVNGNAFVTDYVGSSGWSN